MKKLISLFLPTLPFSVAVVCVFGIMYFAMQQYIRLSANEQPLRYAEDTRDKLASGAYLSTVFGNLEKIDFGKSLSPFVIICDSSGAPQAGSAALNDRWPVPPPSAFRFAKQAGINKISWQPAPGVRIAAVILPARIGEYDAYILGGQSLMETEEREQFLFLQVVAGTLITLVLTCITTLIVQFNCKRLYTAYH